MKVNSQSHNNLFEKYEKAGPRYTSFPAYPFWKNSPDLEAWTQHLQENYSAEKGIILYIHVPFCERLCRYCGCHRLVTRDLSIEKVFVESIKK
jgi:oxygen-independent coproporphyrinogen-3 oxidase